MKLSYPLAALLLASALCTTGCSDDAQGTGESGGDSGVGGNGGEGGASGEGGPGGEGGASAVGGGGTAGVGGEEAGGAGGWGGYQVCTLGLCMEEPELGAECQESYDACVGRGHYPRSCRMEADMTCDVFGETGPY